MSMCPKLYFFTDDHFGFQMSIPVVVIINDVFQLD